VNFEENGLAKMSERKTWIHKEAGLIGAVVVAALLPRDLIVSRRGPRGSRKRESGPARRPRRNRLRDGDRGETRLIVDVKPARCC